MSRPGSAVQRVALRGPEGSPARWLDHGDDPSGAGTATALAAVWSQTVLRGSGAVHVLGADLAGAGTGVVPGPTAGAEVPDDDVPAGFVDHLSQVPPSDGPVKVQRCGVYAVVVLERRVLLTRLAGRGRWTLPGGGIDLGEHPRQALAREVDEETGLHLLAADPVELRTSHWTGRSPNGRLEDFHAVRFLYRGQVGEGHPEVREVGGTSDQAAWFALSDLAGLDLTPMVAGLVADWPDLHP